MKNKNKKFEGYDIIGDVHGRAQELKALLGRLGYAEAGGSFRHPDRQAVFVGDLVDRGPEVGTALAIVKSMVDAGDAQAVIGNHDYNLLGWYTPSPGRPREYLRVRGDKNRRQAATSLAFFEANPAMKEIYFPWLLDLPLYLDLGGLRVVHAAWDERAMADLGGARTLREAGFGSFERKGSIKGDALSLLLSGHEMPLPLDLVYKDRHGEPRKDFRVRWWQNKPGAIYADVSMNPEAALPNVPAPADRVAKLPGYADDAPPVFLGHYGFRSPPGLLRHNIASVDYETPGGSPIGAYRWNGESVLKEENFV